MSSTHDLILIYAHVVPETKEVTVKLSDRSESVAKVRDNGLMLVKALRLRHCISAFNDRIKIFDEFDCRPAVQTSGATPPVPRPVRAPRIARHLAIHRRLRRLAMPEWRYVARHGSRFRPISLGCPSLHSARLNREL